MSKTATGRRTGRLARLVVAPIGAVALVGLAACGSSATSTAGDTASGSTAAAGAPSDSAMAAFTSCLAENGVTMPERPGGGAGGPAGGTPPSGAPGAPGDDGDDDGGPGGPDGTPGQAPPGVDATTWAAAQKACASLAPTPPDGAGTSGTNSSDADTEG